MPIYIIYQTMTSLSIYNNTTDYGSHHIVAGDNSGSASLTGCNIYSNTLGPHFDIWQDSPAGSSTMHADGIFVFAGNTASSATCNIYNNYITGDMCTRSNLNCTGYIYLDGNNNSWVFNNRVQHIPSTGDGPEGGMVQRATANAYSGNHFVNNTFIGATQTNALQFKIGTTAHPGTNLTAENNIWSTGRYGYGFGANNFNELGTSDYNIFYSESAAVATKGVDSSPTNYVTLANWQSASSEDAHSVNTNPLLTSFVPQAGSSAISQGVNLYASCSAQPTPGLGALCSDALGNARSASLPWTAGAVEYQGGGGGGTVVAPVCTPGAGGYSASQTITCTDATPSATICLVLTAGTSGIPPTAPTPGTCGAGSTTYTVPFAVSSTSVLEALGTLVGSTNSSVMTAPYTITPPGGGGATFSVGQIEVHGEHDSVGI